MIVCCVNAVWPELPLITRVTRPGEAVLIRESKIGIIFNQAQCIIVVFVGSNTITVIRNQYSVSIVINTHQIEKTHSLVNSLSLYSFLYTMMNYENVKLPTKFFSQDQFPSQLLQSCKCFKSDVMVNYETGIVNRQTVQWNNVLHTKNEDGSE